MAIILAVSHPFPRKQLYDMPALAAGLRSHTESCLEPEALLDIISAYEQRLLELGNERKIAYIMPEDGDGMLGVNLMHR